MDWFQCFNCRKLTQLEDSANPVCSACGSVHGQVINSKALEEEARHRYRAVLEILQRTKRKPST
jgi:hypothetical protein